jgi:hypothetical protein
MKKIFTYFYLCCFSFLAHAQKIDSTRVQSIGEKRQVIDSLDIVEKKDANKSKDSLKNKSFFARQSSKINNWSSPKKAALLSAVLPGSGQIYNKKGLWWRLPLCYGAYGAAIYTHITVRKRYFFYKDIYDFKVINPSKPYIIDDINYQNVDLDKIYRARNSARDNYERSFLWLGGAYIYCVADAFVTAHLNAFDINDDLSLKIKPSFDWVAQKPMLGIALQF